MECPAALYTCDRAGYIQLFNEAAVELWGYTPANRKRFMVRLMENL